MNNTDIKLFIDMDGVIADFKSGVEKIMPDFVEGKSDTSKSYDRKMWKTISLHQKNGGRLWENLPLMIDAIELWEYVKPYTPEILSACGEPRFDADTQKRSWIAKHFGSDVKMNLVRRAIEKAVHAKPGYILIDDKMKAIQPWRDAGGTGILHTSAANTITQLKQILI